MAVTEERERRERSGRVGKREDWGGRKGEGWERERIGEEGKGRGGKEERGLGRKEWRGVGKRREDWRGQDRKRNEDE